jgi:hypothetical protein
MSRQTSHALLGLRNLRPPPSCISDQTKQGEQHGSDHHAGAPTYTNHSARRWMKIETARRLHRLHWRNVIPAAGVAGGSRGRFHVLQPFLSRTISTF